MSQPYFARLPFFLLPTLPLTFSPCGVSSYSQPLWSFAPGMPSHAFPSLKAAVSSPPITGRLPRQTCARCSVRDGAARPCHDQHSPVPVNDTYRDRTVPITMVAISGKILHSGSAPVQGTVDVTPATLDDAALAAAASHALSLSSIFTVYAETEREADGRLGDLGDKLVTLAVQSK